MKGFIHSEAPVFASNPIGQSMHALLPSILLNVPLAQRIHVVDFDIFENVPIGQRVHDVFSLISE
jgi:hypothetical protein